MSESEHLVNRSLIDYCSGLLTEKVKTYKNWPKPGVDFKDIQSILIDPNLFKTAKLGLIELLPSSDSETFAFDKILAFDARGFIFGSILSLKSKRPMILARKPGKLPGELLSQEFGKEYGKDIIQIQTGLVNPGDRVLIHDDLLATGGTSGAAAELVLKCGGVIAGFHYLMELEFLPGRKVLEKYTSSDKIVSLIKY